MQVPKALCGAATAAALIALPLLTNGCADPVSAAQFDNAAVSSAAFSGTWQFNKELSDCPDPSAQGAQQRDQLRDGTGPNHPFGGGMGRGGASGGRMKGPDGMGGHDGPGGPPDSGIRACRAEGAVLLTIAVTGGAVTFSHEGDRSHSVPTDGSAVTHQGPGGEVSVSGAWVDGTLVVTQSTPRGIGTITYSVAADGSQLTVVRAKAFDGADREPPAMTHVWDRVEG
jgi:hypothetical protein